MSIISIAQKSTQGNSSREVLSVVTLVTTLHKCQCYKHFNYLDEFSPNYTALNNKHVENRLSSQKRKKIIITATTDLLTEFAGESYLQQRSRSLYIGRIHTLRKLAAY